MGRILLVLLLFYFHVNSSTYSPHSSAPLCLPEESSVLLQLKNTLSLDSKVSDSCNSTSPAKTNSWNETTNCCLWEGVTCDNDTAHVIALDLSCSWLVGSLPPNITLVNLVHLDLSSNTLSGVITSELLAELKSLETLDLSNNNLTGEIPAFLCRMGSLEVLDLSINNLGGNIPTCLGSAYQRRLSTIDIQMNKFQGKFPDFASEYLQILALNDNQFEGLLPRSLAKCTSLAFLNVANNTLNDTFPHWLGSLPDLKVLVLRSNRFHGGLIENEIASYSFSSLEVIDLSENMFTGSLPTIFFQNLTAMKSGSIPSPPAPPVTEAASNPNAPVFNCSVGNLYRSCMPDPIYWNYVEVVIKRFPQKLRVSNSLKYRFTIIDFSKNRFDGRIPEVLGELDSLKVLNLSSNHLTGSIPPLLVHMAAIESLDLSSNNLGGQIPPDLVYLASLAVLNLSHNNLVGPIPQGMQFNTFDIDSYSGNPGLWDCPLPIKCKRFPQPPPDPPRITDQDEEDDSQISFSWKAAMMGYGSGVVLGLSMGYIVFTTGRPWWIVRKIERDWQKNVTNWIRRLQGRRK
ncbi:hypothetical protein COLO4_29348 [Corchorus olitorius]|uniref:Leucine-rich repeat-containing N-terminal plant-type domain-containing protein n=1 Tax=Corchorus olitorius TaxID=93759 RepID=A0A1R3HF32_9ROSI|nr:hypothetical protein COLO4_29348 [Corchorus olitorius]